MGSRRTTSVSGRQNSLTIISNKFAIPIVIFIVITKQTAIKTSLSFAFSAGYYFNLRSLQSRVDEIEIWRRIEIFLLFSGVFFPDFCCCVFFSTAIVSFFLVTFLIFFILLFLIQFNDSNCRTTPMFRFLVKQRNNVYVHRFVLEITSNCSKYPPDYII